MTPSAFAALVLPYARQVQAATGIDAWAVVTQWALETGSGSSPAFVNGHNPAGLETRNVQLNAYVLNTYPSLQAGTDDYIRYLGNGYYANVLATAGQGVEATLWALGNSPWSSAHYGNPPGQNLVNLWTSTYAAIAGQTPTATNATSLYSALWVSIVALERAAGASYVPAPWAAAQTLSGEHLGSVPSVAEGATYMVQMLQGVAVSAPGSHVFSSPAVIPAGDVSPVTALGPVYVALVNAALAYGTDVLGTPWAATQGLTGHHWGTPPSLDSGVSYLQGQVDAVTRHIQGIVLGPPPTTVPPAGSGTPPTQPPPVSGAGVPLPQPPPSSGTGQTGLEASWANLLALITETLPAAAARVSAAINAQGGGTGRPPNTQ